MAAITTALAAFVAGLDHSRLPQSMQVRTRLPLLGPVGNMLRGRHAAESTPPLLPAARALGLRVGASAVIGGNVRWMPAEVGCGPKCR